MALRAHFRGQLVTGAIRQTHIDEDAEIETEEFPILDEDEEDLDEDDDLDDLDIDPDESEL